MRIYSNCAYLLLLISFLCFSVDPNQEALEKLNSGLKNNVSNEVEKKSINYSNKEYENKKDFNVNNIRTENFSNKNHKYLSDQKAHLYEDVILNRCLEDQLHYSHIEELGEKELSALSRQRWSALIPKFEFSRY